MTIKFNFTARVDTPIVLERQAEAIQTEMDITGQFKGEVALDY